MKIAIIAWGSLVWDPRDLPREGTWCDDGPELPIEFSKISKDARLTLVIDTNNGTVVRTMHVMSPRTSLQDAREDLRRREGTIDDNIGWVDLIHNKASDTGSQGKANLSALITSWCRERGYDAAVWTALSPNFEKETGEGFSLDAALNYLEGLPKNVRKEALRYIRNAPDRIATPVRQKTKEKYGEQ